MASQKNRSIVSYVVFFGEDQPSPQVTGKRSTDNASDIQHNVIMAISGEIAPKAGTISICY